MLYLHVGMSSLVETAYPVQYSITPIQRTGRLISMTQIQTAETTQLYNVDIVQHDNLTQLLLIMYAR